MQLECPKCGTREIRVSRRHGLLEAIKALGGIYPLRCRRCRHRWLTSAWASGAWRFARCPRCYRQDLSTWSEQYYHPPRMLVAMLRMGATPYRCAACRCNFASFKPCKEKFSWRHEPKPEPAPPETAPELVLPDTVANANVVNANTAANAIANAINDEGQNGRRGGSPVHAEPLEVPRPAFQASRAQIPPFPEENVDEDGNREEPLL